MLYFRLIKSVPNISSNILKHLQEETIKQLQTNIEVGRHCGFVSSCSVKHCNINCQYINYSTYIN